MGKTISAVINLEPQPALRPRRASGYKMFTDPKYRKYQELIHEELKKLNLEPGHYVHLELISFISGKPEGELIEEKPDCDNYTKAIKDALAKAKILRKPLKQKSKKGETFFYDDAMIASENSLKIGCGDSPGVSFFMLMDKEAYFEKYGNPADLFKK
jgi:Holliday junction resolvase RusA-like endonuclease